MKTMKIFGFNNFIFKENKVFYSVANVIMNELSKGNRISITGESIALPPPPVEITVVI